MSTTIESEKKDNVAIHDEALDLEKPGAVKRDYSGAAMEISPLEKKLVRKLDIRIMPTLWLMYWLNYLDRNAIALAKLDKIDKDLKLTATRKSTSTTCMSKLLICRAQNTLLVFLFSSSGKLLVRHTT